MSTLESDISYSSQKRVSLHFLLPNQVNISKMSQHQYIIQQIFHSCTWHHKSHRVSLCMISATWKHAKYAVVLASDFWNYLLFSEFDGECSDNIVNNSCKFDDQNFFYSIVWD